MSTTFRENCPELSEHHVSPDRPSIEAMWDDLKERTGLPGTPLAADGAASWRGTLLGRNRYQFQVNATAEQILVGMSGRDTPGRPRMLVDAKLSEHGLAVVVARIVESETPAEEVA